jgi:hypothetical protein
MALIENGADDGREMNLRSHDIKPYWKPDCGFSDFNGITPLKKLLKAPSSGRI